MSGGGEDVQTCRQGHRVFEGPGAFARLKINTTRISGVPTAITSILMRPDAATADVCHAQRDVRTSCFLILFQRIISTDRIIMFSNIISTERIKMRLRIVEFTKIIQAFKV